MLTNTLNMAPHLLAWRRKNKQTRTQTAKLISVPFRTYKDWENGRPVRHPELLILALEHVTFLLKQETNSELG